MPRPKNYNRNDALNKACLAFWQYGYHRLGVRALENMTGLNRFAIQTEFKGKEGLFIEALQHYSKQSEINLFKPLQSGNLLQIENLLKNIVTPAQKTAENFGCLMVNTTIENTNPENSTIKNLTNTYFKKLELAFQSALKNAKTQKQVANNFNITEAACFLLGSTMGAQVIIRKSNNTKAARVYIRTLLNTVKSWSIKPKAKLYK